MYTNGCTSRIYFRASFFVIYINDLATDLKLKSICFTVMFSVVSDPLETANILNKDIDKIRDWAEQWEMAFNLDRTKLAQEVAFPENLMNLFILIPALINLWLKKCKPKSS